MPSAKSVFFKTQSLSSKLSLLIGTLRPEGNVLERKKIEKYNASQFLNDIDNKLCYIKAESKIL